ncbi:MAG TPA: hypothetical protein VLE97_05775 [Gaiellaceae bacterium]|nr:hypothetical protein [Gaiellaceae bacterium]
MTDEKNRGEDARETVRLDVKDLKPSWPIVVAMLEQLGEWPARALRLGILALAQNCIRELANQNASAEDVARLRELADALAYVPLEK